MKAKLDLFNVLILILAGIGLLIAIVCSLAGPVSLAFTITVQLISYLVIALLGIKVYQTHRIAAVVIWVLIFLAVAGTVWNLLR